MKQLPILKIISMFLMAAALLTGCDKHPKGPLPIGADGEGYASIDRDIFTAGELTRFKVTFVAGKLGLNTGARISLGFHHGSTFSFQPSSPQAASQVSAKRSDTQEMMTLTQGVPHIMFPRQRPEKFSSAIFNQTFIATITGKPLPPGEKITFMFGNETTPVKIQKNVDLEHEIRVATDLNGDGVFSRTDESIRLKILNAPAIQITATAPSQVIIGDEFPLTVRADDPYYNIDENFSQKVSVKDERGNIIIPALKFKNGIAKTTISIPYEGPQRLRFSTPDGNIEGRSNPFQVMKNLPERKIYWGDIHGHTGFSDGLGRDRDAYFLYGRDVAALDVLALTDHGHADWADLITTVKKFHDEGKFVTLLAQEAGAKDDHMNIYLRRDNLDHISQWQTDYVKFQDHLIKQYNTEEELAQTAPHHFAYNRGRKGNDLYPFGHWDTRVARFVEVYSSHGTSEFRNNPRPLHDVNADERKYMQWGLNQGLRFGVIGASDNHNSKPGHSWWGLYSNGLAAFIAPDLTRENIWNSLWNYQTYATSFDRIYMELTLNGQHMGANIDVDKTANFKGYFIGKVDELTATLIRNGEDIYTVKSDNGVINLDYKDQIAPGDYNYYLRIDQSNGERAWSSPFWVKRAK